MCITIISQYASNAKHPLNLYNYINGIYIYIYTLREICRKTPIAKKERGNFCSISRTNDWLRVQPQRLSKEDSHLIVEPRDSPLANGISFRLNAFNRPLLWCGEFRGVLSSCLRSDLLLFILLHSTFFDDHMRRGLAMQEMKKTVHRLFR